MLDSYPEVHCALSGVQVLPVEVLVNAGLAHQILNNKKMNWNSDHFLLSLSLSLSHSLKKITGIFLFLKVRRVQYQYKNQYQLACVAIYLGIPVIWHIELPRDVSDDGAGIAYVHAVVVNGGDLKMN